MVRGKVMLENRKNGGVVCKCEYECVWLVTNLSIQLIGTGIYAHSHPNRHTQTQFFCVLKTASRVGIAESPAQKKNEQPRIATTRTVKVTISTVRVT
jgi:hypothetical protein